MELKASDLVSAICTCIRAQRPLFIHGQPGGGKSALVRQAAEKEQMELRDVRASQLESVDLRGLPYIEGGQTHWSFPNFLPAMFVLNEKGELVPNMSRGVIFLDELNQANQSTQAASYQLILDRRLGDYELPRGWSIIAAGNRAIDKAIANKMGSALKNRFSHAELIIDDTEWLLWAVSANIHPSIIGFIRFKPTALNELAGNGAEGKKRMEAALEKNAFATPRSWEFVSDLLNANPDPRSEMALIEGTVGPSCAADFMGFLRVYRDLPDLDDLIKNPDKAKIPKDKQTLFALSSGLAAKATPANFGNIVKYMDRGVDKEFQMLIVKDAQQRDINICQTKSYIDWLAVNGHLL